MADKLFEFAELLRQHARRRHTPEDHAPGRRGEDIAQRFLRRVGIIVVDRIASGAGEVDLVGWEGNTLVFVEVNSCQSDQHGAPDGAIGLQKQSSLIRAARQYAQKAEVPWQKVRFDVVNVVFKTFQPAITHFRDVLGSRTLTL